MENEWQKVRIDDIKAPHSGAIAIGPFGSRMKADVYVDSGTPVIRGNNLGGRQFKGDFVYVPDDFAAGMPNCLVSKDDLVFPHRGAIGEVGIVSDETTYIISTSLMKLSLDEEQADPSFVFHFFKSEQGRYELLKNASTVGTPGIGTPLTSLRNIEIPLPPLPIQRQIAAILSAFDDKIELNRQMNRTLEQMARALFKSWFVDFDPVRARMRGEVPEGMNAETAALFPDELVEVGGREIPKGWTWQPLDKVCQRITDGAHQSPASQDTGYPMASVKDMDEWGLNLDSCRKISIEDYESLVSGDCKPKYGDVLIAKDGSFLKHVFPVYSEQNVVILSSIALLRPNTEKIDSFILTLILRDDETKSRLLNIVSGAVIQRIVLRDFRKFTIILPPKILQDALMIELEALRRVIFANKAESAQLTQLRNALLPRLLSGEVDVGEWEPETDEA